MKTFRFTKALVLLLFALEFAISANAQECGNITLSSQADVDAFSCTTITGYLVISGADITDLQPLSSLTSVGGFLYIANNTLLANLDGLSALAAVGGDLYIVSNASLSEYCGLYTLLDVGGLTGNYVVFSNAVDPTQQEIMDGGPCTTCDIQINSTTIANEGCPEANDGSISIDASCTTCQGLEYSIDGSTFQFSNEFTNLSHGSYSVYVRDVGDNSCSVSTDVYINPGTDTESPQLTAVSSPIIIWPPNHKYETFSMDQLITGVSDNCAELSIDDVYIESIYSDEPDNGINDGNTTNDILVGSDCSSVQLRRERDEFGNGRVYTVNLVADDGNGNTGMASLEVHVPVGKDQTSVNDGEDHAETCIKSSIVKHASIDDVKMVNYPNPFNSTTTIAFTLPQSGKTSLKVYNSVGYLVTTLFDGYAEEERQYKFDFDGSSLSNGIYIYQLQTENGTHLIKKMFLMK